MAEVITEAFQSAGREGDIQAAVNRYIRERNITCDFLFWLCKNRPAVYASLIEPQLFMAILSVLEKDQFSEIKKGTKLYELIPGRQGPHRCHFEGCAGGRCPRHHPRDSPQSGV